MLGVNFPPKNGGRIKPLLRGGAQIRLDRDSRELSAAADYQSLMKKKSKIPEFKSHQKEAEFWDTHSVTEFLDELTPLQVVYTPFKQK